MKCRYVLLECMIGSRKSYGIAAVCDCDECTVLQSAADLCADRDAVADFVDQCNTLGLSLCHLSDVIDDFLASL